MAKVENPDAASLFTNPAAYSHPATYSQIKNEKNRDRTIRRSSGKTFSRIFNEFRGKTADELGAVQDLPVSEETETMLMDEVHSAGSALRDRPCQEEILRYKQAVRNFMNYVVKNSYALEQKRRPPARSRPGSHVPELAAERKPYTMVHVIDKKLDDMAAAILAGQMDQLKLIAGLEEINGLLIDLLQ